VLRAPSARPPIAAGRWLVYLTTSMGGFLCWGRGLGASNRYNGISWALDCHWQLAVLKKWGTLITDCSRGPCVCVVACACAWWEWEWEWEYSN
jgi:hypothetical protein